MKHLFVPSALVVCGIALTVAVSADRGREWFRFAHEAHRAVACADCHGKEPGPDDHFSMKPCYACHLREAARLGNCRVCHRVSPDGRMVDASGNPPPGPPDFIKGPTHGTGWEGNHARVAGGDSGFCANCHRETFCTDCHTGKRRPRNVHPGDWMSTHGVHSGMDNPRCMGCHRTQSFCITCHRRAGVAPDAPTDVRAPHPGNFHQNASPAQICRRARTDIAACASCHSEASCISCHARVNPHPAGFARRCRPLARQNRRACVKCHDGNPEQLCR